MKQEVKEAGGKTKAKGKAKAQAQLVAEREQLKRTPAQTSEADQA
jgi:hypothetical protein